jgi:hypothetical protein
LPHGECATSSAIATAIDTLREWRVILDVRGDTYAHARLIPAGDDPTDWRRGLEVAVMQTPAAAFDLPTLGERAIPSFSTSATLRTPAQVNLLRCNPFQLQIDTNPRHAERIER